MPEYGGNFRLELAKLVAFTIVLCLVTLTVAFLGYNKVVSDQAVMAVLGAVVPTSAIVVGGTVQSIKNGNSRRNHNPTVEGHAS